MLFYPPLNIRCYPRIQATISTSEYVNKPPIASYVVMNLNQYAPLVIKHFLQVHIKMKSNRIILKTDPIDSSTSSQLLNRLVRLIIKNTQLNNESLSSNSLIEFK